MLADPGASLAACLLKLAKYVRDQVCEARQSGKIVEVSSPYVKACVTSFSYRDQGAINIGTTYEYTQRSEFHWRHQYAFADTIRTSPAFKECVPAVAAETAATDAQAEFQLSGFVGVLVSKSWEGQSDEGLLDLLTTFVADLHGAPMVMDVSAWLDGLWLNCSSLDASGLHLRRPEAKDFEYERSLDAQMFGWGEPWPLAKPPLIVSFGVRGTGMVEAQKAVDAAVNVLRLYRLGSVQSVRYAVRPRSIIRFGGTIGAGSVGAAYKYELGSSDAETLSKFLDRMRPLVPSEHEPGASTPSPVVIGFRRYSEAVLARGDLQERITSGITCLEALFLKDKERADLSYRLSLRVAGLLRLVGFHGLTVKEHVHEAYDIRSQYIHGGTGDPATLRRADELCRHVLDYARVALVIFLQLAGSLDKNEIVSRLDGGLLEEKKLEKLKASAAALLIPSASHAEGLGKAT